jgi:hypothetical protein
LSFGGSRYPRDDLQERTLPRPIPAYNPHSVALLDIEAQVLQGPEPVGLIGEMILPDLGMGIGSPEPLGEPALHILIEHAVIDHSKAVFLGEMLGAYYDTHAFTAFLA